MHVIHTFSLLFPQRFSHLTDSFHNLLIYRNPIFPSQINLLTGEEDMSHPPLLPTQVKSRFRNGHASFRLRMLQEQHGGTGGFEPVSTVLLDLPYFLVCSPGLNYLLGCYFSSFDKCISLICRDSSLAFFFGRLVWKVCIRGNW